MHLVQLGRRTKNTRGTDEEACTAKVLFVDMPFRDIRGSSLGISTLTAILERDGIRAESRYLSVKLARRIGAGLYQFISALGGGAQRGEIFFTPHYFGRPVEAFIGREMTDHFAELIANPNDLKDLGADWDPARFLRACADLCRGVPRFIDEVAAEIPWEDYDIIGFSLMFDQTIASLLLARWIKEHFPEKSVIFGGASCEGEMGVEMVSSFACVDVVATTEADRAIGPLVRAIRRGDSLRTIPGIAFREAGEVVHTTPAPPLEDLDWLPVPDHDEYFKEVAGVPVTPTVYFESSRGCWWGQKHLCTFCGLNATGLAFRRKSAERTLQEIAFLTERYGCSFLLATDNILDMSFYKTVLPRLKERNRDPEKRVSLFFEMKSNVKKAQLELARDAGIIAAQPGIESFSDHILSLMDKGATGMQQVQFLRWATELGISLRYGILHGIAGETADDWDEMHAMIEFIGHLLPPNYVAPISLDRFSPYFNDPAKYGIENVRPHKLYARIFPDPAIALEKLAYKFVYDHSDLRNEHLQAAIARCCSVMAKWRDTYAPDTLVYDVFRGEIRVLDRREDRPRLTVLRGLQAEIFLHCDEARRRVDVLERFASAGDARVSEYLERLTARRWLYTDRRGRCLIMPVRRRLPRAMRGEPIDHGETLRASGVSF